jgi:DNA integrity scanning protein DisA with diadenylate cyclase activity
MRVACCISKATHRHILYVMLISFPLQQLLPERHAVLRYTYIACFVCITNNIEKMRDIRLGKGKEK